METQKILGVDFDNTLFLNSFPDNFTEPNWPVIRYVKKRQREGWYIILVTCRTAANLVNDAVQAAEGVGIVFDAINANHPEQVAKWGDCRKIYCDEYIDDKNISIPEIESHEVRKIRRTVYIAGKMRGLEDLGKRHFNETEALLLGRGFTVLNPSILPTGMPDEKYMPICLSMIDAADIVYMLNGWQNSKGATAEFYYAVCQGKTIKYECEEPTEGT